MTLQQTFDSKNLAKIALQGYRKIGFTGKVKKSKFGDYFELWIGSFGARYKKLKRQRKEY